MHTCRQVTTLDVPSIRYVSELQHVRRDTLAEAPNPGVTLSLRLECCAVDLPTRVLDVQGTSVFVTAPIHLCGRRELHARFSSTWESKTGIARSTGSVESQRRLPPTWVLKLEGPIERLEIEERFPDDTPGTLEVGSTRLPARVVDRSIHGAACVVPAMVRIQPGQRVRVIVGQHDRKGTVARVRPLANQLRVGIRLDDI